MFLLIKKDEKNVIRRIAKTKGYQNSGNYLLDEGLETEEAIPQSQIACIYELDEMPEKVEAEKWCYSEENGFYKNENYVEHFSAEQRIAALEDAVNTLLGF